MKSEIQQKLRQYLVHSFLYYQLDESLINDSYYDQICNELRELMQSNPELDIPHWDLAKSTLGEEASGFAIQRYPCQIISTSLHLLYRKRYQDQMGFTHFLERYGYKLLLLSHE